MNIGKLFSLLSVNKGKVMLAGLASSCSFAAFKDSNNSNNEYRIMVNYNGQADLLLSLQIPPDYYPYQFKKTALYDYLTNIDKYIISNEHVNKNKQKIKKNLQSRINELLGKIKEFGPSLWNQDLYDTGIVFRNNQFWNHKKTSLLFLEQFIYDDYTDIRDAYDLLPAHKDLIITNYRAARDPYTIFSKTIFECFKNGTCPDEKEKKIYEKFKKFMDSYDLKEITSLYRFGRFINFWNDFETKNKEELEKLKFSDLIKNKDLFSLDTEEDKLIAEKYLKSVFSEEEICILNKWAKGEDHKSCEHKSNDSNEDWKMNYQNEAPKLAHHPALEQQVIPGTAPLSEGSQKDIMLFLYQFAASIQHYTTTDNFKNDFSNDYRKQAMEKVVDNAQLIGKHINERIKNIRNYFKKIKVVDENFDPEKNIKTTTNSKTFTILTYPPTSFGAGEATIQSMSKFPWLYQDIGLKQPIPKSLKPEKVHDEEKKIFSVDDNGWWWNLGSANLNSDNLLEFRETTDTLLILANEDDWNLLQDSTSGILSAASSVLKNFSKIDLSKIQGNEKQLRNNKNYPVSYNKYHLWNEGLRSPISLNLMLDTLIDIFQKQYDSSFSGDSKEEYKKAMDWGEYWHTHFLSRTNANKNNIS